MLLAVHHVGEVHQHFEAFLLHVVLDEFFEGEVLSIDGEHLGVLALFASFRVLVNKPDALASDCFSN